MSVSFKLSPHFMSALLTFQALTVSESSALAQYYVRNGHKSRNFRKAVADGGKKGARI
jgi:hypothetical protein